MKRLMITAITAIALMAGITGTANAAADHHCQQAVRQHRVIADTKTSCRTARAVEYGITHGSSSSRRFPTANGQQWACVSAGDWFAQCIRVSRSQRWVRIYWNESLV
jgi:hypothetical protein